MPGITGGGEQNLPIITDITGGGEQNLPIMTDIKGGGRAGSPYYCSAGNQYIKIWGDYERGGH